MICFAIRGFASSQTRQTTWVCTVQLAMCVKWIHRLNFGASERDNDIVCELISEWCYTYLLSFLCCNIIFLYLRIRLKYKILRCGLFVFLSFAFKTTVVQHLPFHLRFCMCVCVNFIWLSGQLRTIEQQCKHWLCGFCCYPGNVVLLAEQLVVQYCQ